MPEIVDALGRTPIAEGMKALINAAFSVVPDGKRAALLIIGDERGARVHLAARVNGSWKVAGGAGFDVQTKKPNGWVGVEASW